MPDNRLGHMRRARPYESVLKPLVDQSLALVLLAIVLPLMLLVAILVRISLGRGVLFRQERVGQAGRPFSIYKFRTMTADRRVHIVPFTNAERRRSHKDQDDPRHTRLGLLLRALSLDELPQLLNVLRGEMSLVGPRPELAAVVNAYEPWQHARHQVRPGMTGLWQISGHRDAPMHAATALDLDYVDRLSLRTDLAILVRTLPAVARRRTF